VQCIVRVTIGTLQRGRHHLGIVARNARVMSCRQHLCQWDHCVLSLSYLCIETLDESEVACKLASIYLSTPKFCKDRRAERKWPKPKKVTVSRKPMQRKSSQVLGRESSPCQSRVGSKSGGHQILGVSSSGMAGEPSVFLYIDGKVWS
jgi:hypothetical protein